METDVKKVLMAAALATAGVGAQVPAQAQSNVSFVGLIDAYVGNLRLAGDAGRKWAVNGNGMTTSYFGVTGSEDLGDGLKATFALTSFFRTDVGGAGRFDGDPFWARDANVGLAGSFGHLILGRMSAPNFIPSVLANPFGNSFNFSPLILHANVTSAGWNYRTTPSDTGWGNQAVYVSPTIGGLRATVQYQFGEQASGTSLGSKHNFGLNLIYNSGPLTLLGYYERDQISNPNPSVLTTTVGGNAVPTTRPVWMLGGTYDAGFLKAYATYGRASAEVTNQRAKTTTLGLSIPVGQAKRGSILAAVARTDATGPLTGARTTASLGYDYNLSKRTDLYAVTMLDRVTNKDSGTSMGVGIRHRF